MLPSPRKYPAQTGNESWAPWPIVHSLLSSTTHPGNKEWWMQRLRAAQCAYHKWWLRLQHQPGHYDTTSKTQEWKEGKSCNMGEKWGAAKCPLPSQRDRASDIMVSQQPKLPAPVWPCQQPIRQWDGLMPPHSSSPLNYWLLVNSRERESPFAYPLVSPLGSNG